MTNEEIARKAMDIATDLCIYSNKNYVIEEIKNSNTKTAGNVSNYNYSNNLL